MSNEKSLVKGLERTLAAKSLSDLVRIKGAENAALAIDASGSMGQTLLDSDGQTSTRIAQLRRVVVGIRAKRAVQMIAFGQRNSDDPGGYTGQGSVAPVMEVPSDNDLGPSTPLSKAIDLARTMGFGKLVVISDGVPDDQHAAMESARSFGGQIDVIFVGMPGEPGSFFLESLAKATGGARFEGDLGDVKEITGAVIGLLNGEVLEEEDEEDDEDESDEDDDEDDDEEE